MNALGFEHVYQPPAAPDQPILLLLHGTGGNENDLLDLAPMIAPGAGVLSPRGKVLERGMPRFFRRLAEGVFDIDDLKFRTAELADFISAAATQYGFDAGRAIAVGFSNGANIAGSLLLLDPGLLGGAVLFRAMVPFVPHPLPSLPGTPVLLSNGRMDPLISAEETERLAGLLSGAGANVSLVRQHAGHELTQADIAHARQWMSSGFARDVASSS